MAPPAKSRKGKKAWRKNIDASEVEAFLEEQTYQERRGPAAKELKDDQLFFMDTTADVDGAAAVADGRRPAKRRREEAVDKPLRAQQIIAEAHKAKALTLAPPPRKAAKGGVAGGVLAPAGAAHHAGGPLAANGRRRGGGDVASADSLHPLDIWGGEDLDFAGAVAATLKTVKQRKQRKEEGQGEEGLRRLDKKSRTAVEAEAAVRVMGPSVRALRRSPPPARVAAVAVDAPGCSFNPDAEQHQDALALLVASEMRKQLRRELLPSAPPEEVDAPQGRPLSELEALQVEEESSDDEEDLKKDGAAAATRRTRLQGGANLAMTVAGAGAGASALNAIALGANAEGEGQEDVGDGGEDGAGGGGRRREELKTKKKTRKDRNKEARRKAAEAEAEERRRVKALRRQLQSLNDVAAEVVEEAREKEVRRLRRAVMLRERAAVEPARLGKLKFKAPSVQVLTSDEKTGSLRQVVPCAMLATDRFKSLQQRGLVEPRKPQPFKERRRKITYEKGARFERAAEASAKVRDMSHRNKKARRQAKAAAARAGGGGGVDDWL